MRTVLVFFGGKSAEHEISVITGVLTVNSIDKNLYNAIPIYVDRKGEWFTLEGEELLARAICHECEHLDGHLFLEKVTKFIED